MLFWIRFSSSCISRRSFRSRAPSGSSRSRAAGRLTRARARATRWRWPPESSAGRRSPSPSRRTIESISSIRSRALGPLDPLQLQPEADVLGDRHVREQRVVLEDHVDVPVPRRDQRHVLAVEHHPARRRLLEAGDHPQRRRLPAPARAEHREELAAGDLDRDVVDRERFAEPLADPLEPDHRFGRGAHQPRPSPIAIANRSLTLVWVGPVSIPSPSAATARRTGAGRSRRGRRPRPPRRASGSRRR